MDTLQLNPDLILLPDRHGIAVQQFLHFFQLNPQKSAPELLTDVLSHFAKIPYENISKIIKYNKIFSEVEKIRLPEEIIHDHIEWHLGGTCFSLTFFLHSILTHLGFINYPVMADMRAGENIHCCVIAIIDHKKYLLDPGYLLNRPMEIHPDKPRIYRAEHVGVELQFDRDAESYHLYTFNHQDMKWRYRFRDRAVPMSEFLRHWLASFEKNSMHGLCLTKMTENGLIYVQKHFMRETFFTGKRNYNIKQNYHQTIQDVFGISSEWVEQALAALAENLARERELGIYVPNKGK